MEYDKLQKLLEIQYLKGRLDELYKGYVPHSLDTNDRIVDSRISKYENKLKETDELAYHLYYVERENRLWSKKKGKGYVKDLLIKCKEQITDEKLLMELEQQINRYVQK